MEAFVISEPNYCNIYFKLQPEITFRNRKGKDFLLPKQSVRLPAEEHQEGPRRCPCLHLIPGVALQPIGLQRLCLCWGEVVGRVCCDGPLALNLLLSLVCHSSDLLTFGRISPREEEKELKGSGEQLKSYLNQLLVVTECLLEADWQLTELDFFLRSL